VTINGTTSTTLDPVDELQKLVREYYTSRVAEKKASAGTAMKPTGTPLPDPPAKKPDPTLTDQVQKKYKEWRDDIAGKLPEKVRKYAKDGMDMVVEKGLPYVLKEGIKKLGVPSDLEGEVKKAVEDYAKKITDDKSKADEAK
jgi:hypothetical protein